MRNSGRRSYNFAKASALFVYVRVFETPPRKTLTSSPRCTRAADVIRERAKVRQSSVIGSYTSFVFAITYVHQTCTHNKLYVNVQYRFSEEIRCSFSATVSFLRNAWLRGRSRGKHVYLCSGIGVEAMRAKLSKV